MARVIVTGAAVFITPEGAAGYLAVKAPDDLVIGFRKLEMTRAAGLLPKNRGSTERFSNVHIMPVGQRARGIPPCHVRVHLAGQVHQPGLAQAIVEPIDALDVVAHAHHRPVARAESGGR